jgi:MFS family permease
MSVLFPFVYFMVRDFNQVKLESIGFYCGIVTASYSFGQTVTSVGWGYLSDKHGRRICLLTGMIGGAICILAFGFSSSILMASISRFMSGLLNGNVGVSKSVIAEITDDHTRPLAFSLVGFMWAMGMICGPILGGFLSSPPESLIPNLFQRFPYALPCIVVAIINFMCFIISFFILEETSPSIGMYNFLFNIDEANVGTDAPELYTSDPTLSAPLYFYRSNVSMTDVFKFVRSESQQSYEEIWDAQSQGLFEDGEYSENSELASIEGISIESKNIIVSYSLLHFQSIMFDEGKYFF